MSITVGPETKNYYDILQIAKGSTDVEIKKAYRKLAMKWHPDKNPQEVQEEAAKKFQDIGEAYDVLSDLKKRAIYDQYGYEGLRDGIPDTTGTSGEGYSYKENAQEIFESFFGTTNPFASFGFGETAPFASKLNKTGSKKADPVVITLDCTLTELYNGCVKEIYITRKRFNYNKELNEDGKVFKITVKPGWKKGTKVTFPGEGDESESIAPADVIFVIQEVKTHDERQYERDGNILIYTYTLSLSDALTDCNLQVPTLDKRLLSIACPEVVSPYYEKLITGEGMPISKAPGSKGDLILKFHILFPKYLNGVKRTKIREILANEDLLT